MTAVLHRSKIAKVIVGRCRRVETVTQRDDKVRVACPATGDPHRFNATNPVHRITKFTDKESGFVRYRKESNDNLGTN
ncbi:MULTISPECIES: hypothetical protein [unclassified Nonomuraea]|uniref:hypothetical protein n=1 Tax=Nonomuraea sp. NPDC049725 TaxID=3154508 RepID=UPI00341A48B4